MNWLFFKKNKDNDNHYLGLFLKEQRGSIFLMKKKDNEIFVIDQINFNYTNGWENLINDIDENLYQLEEKHKVTLSKTIFFLYSHFIDDVTKNIKEPYLKKIKNIAKNLELEALGYIECYEAVSLYLEKKEQNLLSAIILELDKNQLSILIYQGGKLIYKNSLARTSNIVDDFIVAISHLQDKKIFLPSRIIVYDSDDLDKEIDQLINYRWDKNYFIQLPKIEILKDNEVVDALVKIFSKQIEIEKDNFNESESSFGFVIGKDIEQKKIEKTKKINFNLKKLFDFSKFSLLKINFNLSFLNLNSNFLIFFGLLIIFISLFINEYFFHKAYITVYLPSQTIEKKLNTLIDYKVASSQANFSETVLTTGKKEIGEKAKGIVILYNFDDKEETFSKNTVLESNNIRYFLDNDVKVASSTITADASAKLPGKKEVSITAENIGEEANLNKGTRFKISGMPESLYFAINDKPLTGGSRKQIKTVSANDILSLENKVLEKAKNQKINLKLKDNELIINDLTNYEIIDKKFSKEIGEEADSVSIDAKINVEFYVYKKDDLLKYLTNELKKDLKLDLSLEKNNIKFKITQAKKNNDKLEILLDVKAKAIGSFDKDKALRLISGKNKNQIEQILKNNFNTQGFDLLNNDSLPIFNNYLPFFKKNIVLKISSF